jgi:phosphonate transport system substrate-binding protein
MTLGLLAWLDQRPEHVGIGSPSTAPVVGLPLRIGIVPERDIFEQRRRHAAIAAYLTSKLDRPVELVTVRSYCNVLDEFRENHIDAAFLGSLVTVLSVDQLQSRVLVRPETSDGQSTYRGVIFVSETSPLKSLEDLAGRTIVMVPTTAASLFPVAELVRRGMIHGHDEPKMVYVGTHDDTILEVLDGRADAGAVKDLRLAEFERANPSKRFRRLAMSEPVPESALVVRRDLTEAQAEAIKTTFLTMQDDPAGRAALAAFGAARFIPCDIREYDMIFDLVDVVGPSWRLIDPKCPAPARPADRPKAEAP